MSTPVTDLVDSDWHRLHPATPLLRGGIALIAIAGILIANFRERVIDLFIGAPGYEGDPLDFVIDQGFLPIALGVVLLVVLICIGLFYVSWRMNSFRITDELVEVRSGVVFRTNRRARLDRIQGINISRPFVARLLGTAKLEVQVAGDDGKVELAYLGSATADALRGEILRLASGVQRAKAAAPGGPDAPVLAPDQTPPAAGPDAAAIGYGYSATSDAVAQPGAPADSTKPGFVDQRVHELLAPELDPNLPVTSVVQMNAGRLIASTLLGGTALWFIALIVVFVVVLVVTGEPWIIFTLVPMAIGAGSFMINQITKFLRYSIAATPDGVRIGYGLFSTRNETLPPGRIHSISLTQPLLWRPFDWWQVRVNRASRSSSSSGNENQTNSTVLPVGTRAETLRVLELLAPELVAASTPLIEAGFGRGGDDGYTTSPRRAAVLRWFSWRRNGFALADGAVLLRRGAIWRELVIVPTPRVQSVELGQGPLLRRMRLAAVRLHTVAGPIQSHIGALDQADAEGLFRDAAAAEVTAAGADRSHRWGAA